MVLSAFMVFMLAGAPLLTTATNLYAVDTAGNLWSVDTVAQTSTPIGNLGFAPPAVGFPFGGAFVGLDVNPANGKLYVSNTANGQIFTVNTSTAAATLITTVASPGITQNLTFSPAGVLYAAESATLYTIDLGTGVATQQGGVNYPPDHNGLAFAADGTLYGIGGPGPPESFYRVDPATNLSTYINAFGSNCGVGLTYGSDGFLYCAGVNGSSLYRIDPATGFETFVFNTGLAIGDLANQAPAAPTGPTSADQCKKDGWKAFTNPSFKNQGQCVSSVVSNRGGN